MATFKLVHACKKPATSQALPPRNPARENPEFLRLVAAIHHIWPAK